MTCNATTNCLCASLDTVFINWRFTSRNARCISSQNLYLYKNFFNYYKNLYYYTIIFNYYKNFLTLYRKDLRGRIFRTNIEWTGFNLKVYSTYQYALIAKSLTPIDIFYLSVVNISSDCLPDYETRTLWKTRELFEWHRSQGVSNIGIPVRAISWPIRGRNFQSGSICPESQCPHWRRYFAISFRLSYSFFFSFYFAFFLHSVARSFRYKS